MPSNNDKLKLGQDTAFYPKAEGESMKCGRLNVSIHPNAYHDPRKNDVVFVKPDRRWEDMGWLAPHLLIDSVTNEWVYFRLFGNTKVSSFIGLYKKTPKRFCRDVRKEAVKVERLV